MRKGLTISLIICIILLVLCQFVVPSVANNMVETKLKIALRTERIESSISTFPSFMLLFGQMDKLHVEAENGLIGDIRCSKLVLDGTNVDADLSALDLKDGSAVRSAESLTLTGTITEDNLQEYMQSKLGDVESLSVSMKKDGISAAGKVKILGRTADISMDGQLLEENGSIYYRMTSLNVRNTPLGDAVVGNIFGDMQLLNLHGFSFPAEYESVEQHDGYVILKASRRVQEGL